MADVVERDAPHHDEDTIRRTLTLLPERHRRALTSRDDVVAPGYKRTRDGRQVLELRFDGLAGCLRTPKGGSSRQMLVIREAGRTITRLLTVREAARLMGAPDSYALPGGHTDGYAAMGDAVAVPAARFLSRTVLRPLVDAMT